MDLLSIGLEPENVNYFIQSKVPEIAELTVFYSNLVTVARLHRNPTVKTEIAAVEAAADETVAEEVKEAAESEETANEEKEEENNNETEN